MSYAFIVSRWITRQANRCAATPQAKRARCGFPRYAGQVMPMALLGILIASASLVLMYRTGHKVTEKSLVANAADAAAYSGAVWQARHLNFMAYTNRAMIANHVAVGHFVSYMSWLRYVANTIDAIEDYTSWIPYWGQFISIVEQVLLEVRDITEQMADITIPIIDSANELYRAAQLEAQISFSAGGLQDLMERTARRYDPEIRINSDGDAGDLPGGISEAVRAELVAQLARPIQFVQRYSAGDDEDRMRELISRTYTADNDTRRWVAGNRGWNQRSPTQMTELRKQGNTDHSQDDDSADWEAQDRLQVRHRRLTWRGLRWGDWNTLGSVEAAGAADGFTGSASASEFDDDYSGVPTYYNLRGDPGSQSLRVTAFATKRQGDVGASNPQGYADVPLMGMTHPDEPMSSLAYAIVEFRRPSGAGFGSLGGNRVEYANLFNPFWDAHLTRYQLPGVGL